MRAIFRICGTESQPGLQLQSSLTWTKVLGHFAFLGRFPIHTGPTPPLTPQTMLDECILHFFSEFQLCIGWGEGELQENFEKGALFCKGTEK